MSASSPCATSSPSWKRRRPLRAPALPHAPCPNPLLLTIDLSLRVCVAHHNSADAPPSPAGLSAIVSMLPSSEHVRAAYLGPDGVLSVEPHLLHPYLLVDCSTIDPITSREVGGGAREGRLLLCRLGASTAVTGRAERCWSAAPQPHLTLMMLRHPAGPTSPVRTGGGRGGGCLAAPSRSRGARRAAAPNDD